MQALGRHLLVEFFECPAEILNEVNQIEAVMLAAARASRATIINSSFHHFSPYGVSGVVVIQESHLAIHTWPEAGYAAVDLFTCGRDTLPWEAYRYLKQALSAGHSSAIEMQRGSLALLPEPSAPPVSHSSSEIPTQAFQRDVWFTERNDSLALSLRHQGKRLLYHKSPFQRIEIYDTMAYGRMMALDGKIVFTQQDEYIYHEMMVHVPMQVLPQAHKALIIGGGDRGSLRELLRYESLKGIDLVEIDEKVSQFAHQFFPELWPDSDPRVKFHYEDARHFIQRPEAGQQYDLILIDAPQSVGQDAGPFNQDFFRRLKDFLRPGGLLVGQMESPRYKPQIFQRLFHQYQEIFSEVVPYLAFIPTYPSGSWSFCICSHQSQPVQTVRDANITQEFAEKHALRYYDSAVHAAAFCLPKDLRQLLN